MNDRQLTKILNLIKTERRGGAAHDAWVSGNRNILLMQLRTSAEANVKPDASDYVRHLFDIFFPHEAFIGIARAMGVFALVVGSVLGGGLASAQVYQSAVPGEMMYKVKLAVESAQLLLAPNDDYRTRLHGDFADHRLDEVAALAEGSATEHPHIAVALTSFDGEVRALASGLESLKDSDPEGVAEVAKLLERKMTVYQNVLRKAAPLAPGLRKRIASSRDLVDDVTIKSIAVIVEKHLAGNASVPAAVVMSKVEERLRLAEDKLDATTLTEDVVRAEKQTKAKAAIAEAKVLLKEDKYQAALTKIAEVAELTKEVETIDETVTETITEEETPAETVPATPAKEGEGTGPKESGTDVPKPTVAPAPTP